MSSALAVATVTLNPAIDHTLSIPDFTAGRVNRVAWDQADPGGKGVNVASFLADFGFRVGATGFLGDENTQPFEALFDRKGIEDAFVRIPGRTRVNLKILDEPGAQVTDINFPGQGGMAEAIEALKGTVTRLAGGYDWFVLSGSVPREVPVDFYADLARLLAARGKTVVLDTSGPALARAVSEQPFAVKPNLEELQELVGQPLETEAAVLEAARRLVRGGIRCVVVSMGAEGAWFVEAEEAVLAVPPRVTVVSTVGAGDAMVAGLVTAKLRGWALPDCARLATAFSLGALGHIGPRLPEPAAVEAFMGEVQVRRG